MSCLGVQEYKEPGEEDMAGRTTQSMFNLTVANLTTGENCTMYKFSGLMPNRQLPQVCH